MFVKVRRAFTVGAVLLLLFLFIVPSLYLGAQCAALDQLTDRVLSGDQAAYEALTKRYEAMRREFRQALACMLAIETGDLRLLL